MKRLIVSVLVALSLVLIHLQLASSAEKGLSAYKMPEVKKLVGQQSKGAVKRGRIRKYTKEGVVAEINDALSKVGSGKRVELGAEGSVKEVAAPRGASTSGDRDYKVMRLGEGKHILNEDVVSQRIVGAGKKRTSIVLNEIRNFKDVMVSDATIYVNGGIRGANVIFHNVDIINEHKKTGFNEKSLMDYLVSDAHAEDVLSIGGTFSGEEGDGLVGDNFIFLFCNIHGFEQAVYGKKVGMVFSRVSNNSYGVVIAEDGEVFYSFGSDILSNKVAGVFSQGGYSFMLNSKVRKNKCDGDDCDAFGIVIGGGYLEMLGSVISGNDVGIIIQENAKKALVMFNVFRNHSKGDIALYVRKEPGYPATDILVHHNDFEDNALAIAYTGAFGAPEESGDNNHASSAGKFQASQNFFRVYNVKEESVGMAMYDNSGAFVEGNKFENLQYGLSFVNVADVDVSGNMFKKSSSVGVFFDSCNYVGYPLLRRNVFKDNNISVALDNGCPADLGSADSGSGAGNNEFSKPIKVNIYNASDKTAYAAGNIWSGGTPTVKAGFDPFFGTLEGYDIADTNGSKTVYQEP